jgi:hypothetical protein
VGSLFGTATWPVTYQMLELLAGTFSVFMLVIVTFYAGELVWREREHRFDQTTTRCRRRPGCPWSQAPRADVVPLILELLLIVCGIAIQTAKGYYRYEIALYLTSCLTIDLPSYWLICVLRSPCTRSSTTSTSATSS